MFLSIKRRQQRLGQVFAGHDWAKDHHDIPGALELGELYGQDALGVLATAPTPELGADVVADADRLSHSRGRPATPN